MQDEKTKNIYIVRHAQSDANAGGEYKGPHTPLSKKGIEQTKQVAERFTKIPFDIVLTSAFIRAIDTGKAIAEASAKPIDPPVQVFGEREHPPEAVGLLQDSPEYAQIREETWRRFEQNDTSHPGEETFAMLAERAAEAVEYLKKRKENNIVVVSHSNFIRFLVAYMCWGEMLTPRFFIKFLHFAKISNTGITHLVFEEGKWTLHQWNDKAHLG